MKHAPVAVFYGGQSTEHEISIITALQTMHALRAADYPVLPVYLAKDGRWFLGNDTFLDSLTYKNLNQPIASGQECLLGPAGSPPQFYLKTPFNLYKPGPKFTIAFPIFHGQYGEDGSIQGLFKLHHIPITGSSLSATAVGIDKIISKRLAASLGAKVLPDVVVHKSAWESDQQPILQQCAKLGDTLFVKPVTLGSSIGVAKADSRTDLINAVDVALVYDNRVLVEPALKGMVEINLSVMGPPYETSVTEQLKQKGEYLSYDDKYVGNGKKAGQSSKGMASAERIVPAPISTKLTKALENFAIAFYGLINGQGVARIDFFVVGEQWYFNEINLIPGSLAFYLWDKRGKPFPKLVDELVQIALSASTHDNKLVSTFETNLLENLQLSGTKS